MTMFWQYPFERGDLISPPGRPDVIELVIRVQPGAMLPACGHMLTIRLAPVVWTISYGLASESHCWPQRFWQRRRRWAKDIPEWISRLASYAYLDAQAPSLHQIVELRRRALETSHAGIDGNLLLGARNKNEDWYAEVKRER